MNTAKKIERPDSPRPSEAQVIDLDEARYKVSKSLARNSDRLNPFYHNGAVETDDFIGHRYRVNDKDYVLSDLGYVHDLVTKHTVWDTTIIEAVLDLHEEDEAITGTMSRLAQRMAKGDADVERALKYHFAFAGLPATD